MEVTSGKSAFPPPSQIADVPGAENWRSMYPYYTRFQPRMIRFLVARNGRFIHPSKGGDLRLAEQ
jgi:hypothetical protein